jgi:hypothetical protein
MLGDFIFRALIVVMIFGPVAGLAIAGVIAAMRRNDGR